MSEKNHGVSRVKTPETGRERRSVSTEERGGESGRSEDNKLTETLGKEQGSPHNTDISKGERGELASDVLLRGGWTRREKKIDVIKTNKVKI